MQLNIDQLKQDICKQLALINLIEKSKSKALNIITSPYYNVFGTHQERKNDLDFQNNVTKRLYAYLFRLTGEVV